ncbi:O-fucosyltransferase 36-like isoform X1 [Cucurbita maxima]|uniref:O-fucosyltransferase family protein n=1 Tax=Cucurbita maxima TaxID=3661 RepID=A0A6J1IZN4_CUCMA|nr:O-fucosyltransferase 36-like isoform X1 [Cucurbita maxima]
MDRSDSSSDGSDDRQNLIEQNGTERLPSPRNRSTTFDIDDDRHFRPPIHRFRFSIPKFSFHKRYYYLLAAALPLCIIAIFFSAEIRSLFSSVNISSTLGSSDSLSHRRRESELRALYLLRQQQLDFFDIWNHSNTTFNSTATNNLSSNSAPGDAFIEDLKSAILKQIILNKEIQNVLLSPHRSGNLSEVVGDAHTMGTFTIDQCGKIDQKLYGKRTIEWKPKSNKFLFAICTSGQMSNHLICLQKHMFFAAILHRILIIPSHKVDYLFSRVIDIENINTCLGRKVVISFEEFSEIRKHHLHIDRFICYFSKPDPCYVDEEHIRKLKNLGISMGKLESAWNEDAKKPTGKTVSDIESKFSSNDDVVAVGDIFFANVEKEWVNQPGGPIAHKCQTLIEPSRLIKLTAQRFIQTFLGKNYMAIHFRRHGFLKFCNAKQPSCFYPIPQAADCIIRMVERANVAVIYLSTDAAESEYGLLQSLLVLNGKSIPLVRRPPRNSAEKWDALLYRHGIEGHSQVEAMLDKTICAMSSTFIGASGSTFTEDILRLRQDWGSASLCDQYLCQGEEPNFISDQNDM